MYTFVSYSRKQFYFAESLVLKLQQNHIAVWFDIQQLTPGTNWQESLHDGYSNCDSLILVVSKAALASSYVAVEWRSALKRARPIFLIMYEAVELPAELRNCPTYDCRRRFDEPVQTLIKALKKEAPPCFDVVRPMRLIPLRFIMPIAVWQVLISFIGIALIVGQMGLLWTVIPLCATLAFWQHRIRLSVLEWLANAGIVVLIATLVLASPCLAVSLLTESNVFAPALIQLFMPAPLVLQGLLAFQTDGIWKRGRLGSRAKDDLRRWCPTESVDNRETMRVMPRPTAIKTEVGTNVTVVSYSLRYSAPDIACASAVSHVLGRIMTQEGKLHGIKLLKVDAAADVEIVLLSIFTEQEQLIPNTDLKETPRIFILCSPVVLPKFLADVAAVQWIDFRDRDQTQLLRLAEVFGKTHKIIPSVPMPFNNVRLPNKLNMLVTALRVLLGVYAARCIMQLSDILADQSGAMVPMFIWGSAAILMTLCIYGVIERRITPKFFMRNFCAAVLVDKIAMLFFGESLHQTFGAITVLQLMVFGILSIGVWKYAGKTLVEWLPPINHLFSSGFLYKPTLTIKLLLINLLYIGAVILLSLLGFPPILYL